MGGKRTSVQMVLGHSPSRAVHSQNAPEMSSGSWELGHGEIGSEDKSIPDQNCMTLLKDGIFLLESVNTQAEPLRYCVWKLADVTEQKAGKGRLLNRIQEAESMEATDFLRSSEESYRVLRLKHPGQETDYDLMKTTLTLARLVLSETVRHFFLVEANYLVDLYGITIPSTKFNEG